MYTIVRLLLTDKVEEFLKLDWDNFKKYILISRVNNKNNTEIYD